MMEIVPMESRHLDQVTAIEAACFSLPWSREAFAEELDADNAVYFAALEGPDVLGYGGMRFAAGEFYVDNIAVRLSHRRQGVGLAIMKALVDRARSMGGAFISLEVRPSNEAALSLYRQLGFEPVGLRKNFYEKPREDALILTRRFGEP